MSHSRTLFFGALLLSTFSSSSIRAQQQDVLHPYLEEQMSRASAGTQLPAYLVLKDQLSARDLQVETYGLSPREARGVVARRLKSHAARTQTVVREVLDGEINAGRATLTEILWMGNAIYFTAEPASIQKLANVPGIDRIRPIVNHELEAYTDRLGVMASFPFKDNFETCSLQPHWIVQTTGTGYATVSANETPHSGSCHLLMASNTDGSDSTVTVTAVFDLSQETDVDLGFWFKEFADETNPEDGVFVSPDGVKFYKIHDLTGTTTYTQTTLDLDALISQGGLSFSSTFHIRFSWRDNYNIPVDGFALDDVFVSPGSSGPPPPPGDIEPNIVALQAPQLWDIGYSGEGILIGNIDAGTNWSHNDLVNRIWNNPGEIANNGVDDDGNGKIDDIVGWDFNSNDNDPTSPSTHGTLTAGLMVGDGTNGQTTGMAPAGTLVACLAGGETQYFEAQQYLLEVGVDVISSSLSFKWPFSPQPDYHMHRQLCEMELAAGIIHANSIGNQGNSQSTFPIPFNISAPGLCPSPFSHPDEELGGRTSIMACAGIHLGDDSLYTPSGAGPSAWEDITLYEPGYSWSQNTAFWDYPYGGFSGSLPALLKPDIATYTDTVNSTTNNNLYASFSGTSAATPQLGGGLMLLAQVQPEALPRHIAAAVSLTGVDLGPPGKDNRFGSGKLQVFDAAQRLVVLGRIDDPSPFPGQSITVDLFGQPQSTVWAFAAAFIDATPPLFNLTPPFLTLGAFPLDLNGESSFGAALPSDPALSGLSVHMQFGSVTQAGGPWGSGLLLSVPERVDIQ